MSKILLVVLLACIHWCHCQHTTTIQEQKAQEEILELEEKIASLPTAPGAWNENLPSLLPPSKRLRIGITISVPKEAGSMFVNGARQAAFFFYELLALDNRHDPFFINLDRGDPKNVSRPEWQLQDLPIYNYSESVKLKPDLVVQKGMQLSWSQVDGFRQVGSRIANYRVGSNYVLSVENMMFNRTVSAMFVTTGYDAVWYLPSFSRQQHFMHLIYQSPVQRTKSAPFLWTPRFMNYVVANLQQRKFYEPRPGKKSVVVMEPNIDVVKTCLIPLAILDTLYKKDRDLMTHAMISNTGSISKDLQFKKLVFNGLTMYKEKKMSFEGRYPSGWFLSTYADVILSHQWKNELNYLYIEALYLGYPLVHNSPYFKDCGYYYEGDDVLQGVEQLEHALRHHDQNIDDYLQKARKCVWRHSILNPDNVYEWDRLLMEVVTAPPSSINTDSGTTFDSVNSAS